MYHVIKPWNFVKAHFFDLKTPCHISQYFLPIGYFWGDSFLHIRPTVTYLDIFYGSHPCLLRMLDVIYMKCNNKNADFYEIYQLLPSGVKR